MITKPRHYADGGKVQLPGPETRKLRPPPPMPPPKKGEKPKKIEPKKYADGGKVAVKLHKKPKPAQASTVDIMRGKTRREREQALGLKDGGKVKR